LAGVLPGKSDLAAIGLAWDNTLDEPGEREIRVRLSLAEAQWLDGVMSAAGWRGTGTLVGSIVHAVVEDDRAAEQSVVERAA
jgi:hypothetical protein